MQDERETVLANVHGVSCARAQVLHATLRRVGFAQQHTKLQSRLEVYVQSGSLSAILRIGWHVGFLSSSRIPKSEVLDWKCIWRRGLIRADGIQPDFIFLDLAVKTGPIRSEERRVGKECRS